MEAMRSHYKHKNHRTYYFPLTIIKHPQISSHLFNKHTVNPRVKSCWGCDDICGVILASESFSWPRVVTDLYIILIEGEQG